MKKVLNTGFMFSEKNMLRGLVSSFLFSPSALAEEDVSLSFLRVQLLWFPLMFL